ncbi:MAG: dUTP diphosphatase [Victivallaceae bacterium]|nr:dUTP diphosphatase [Victivallaceae bacterium]
MVSIRIMMAEGCEDLFPSKAHPSDAAYDIKASVDITVPVGISTLVPTGMKMEIPFGYEAQVRPRSGLALKHGVTLTNSPGTIDAGYRGEVGLIVINHGQEPFEIRRGDRVAQMVIAKLAECELVAANELGDSDRGYGGFGSSGRN